MNFSELVPSQAMLVTYVNRPDPNGVLAFMVEQLQAAEDAGQKVWVIGHIPLGKEDTMEDQACLFSPRLAIA